MSSKMKAEKWPLGFNNSEVFGGHGNTNFSAVMGQEVIEGETGEAR